MPSRHRGFTLIELLIVVAIIGILAAIAIPNFLQAQVRAKVARTQAEMREIKNAMYQYHVDYSTWPSDQYLGSDPCGINNHSTMFNLQPLSTPVQYLSTVPYEDTFSGEVKLVCGGARYKAHYQYWRWNPPANLKSPRGVKWDEWGVFSQGPVQDWPGGFQIDIAYDPTNGVVSEGLIYASDYGIYGD